MNVKTIDSERKKMYYQSLSGGGGKGRDSLSNAAVASLLKRSCSVKYYFRIKEIILF